MKITVQIISLLLLLPIIGLNIPVAGANPCQAGGAKKQMACCSIVVTHCESDGYKISTQPCGCHLSKTANASFPWVNLTNIFEQNLKKIEKNYTCQDNQSCFAQNPLISSNIEIFFHPKFSSKTKIYTLVESYLI